MTILDVDGDGKQDIVTTSVSDDSVNIFLGNGDGTFKAKASISAGAHALVKGDFNGDGFLDLATEVGTEAHILLADTTTTGG